MASYYPNQKRVRICKAKCDSDHPFGQIQKEALYQAKKSLPPKAFDVWLYLALNGTTAKDEDGNQQNWKCGLSGSEVQEKMNMCKQSYDNAVNTLISKGYLVNTYGKVGFDFYEIPQKDVVHPVKKDDGHPVKRMNTSHLNGCSSAENNNSLIIHQQSNNNLSIEDEKRLRNKFVELYATDNMYKFDDWSYENEFNEIINDKTKDYLNKSISIDDLDKRMSRIMKIT